MSKLVVLFCVLAVALATDVRLVDKQGNVNQQRGRVEVHLDGKWGQVCGNGFGSLDTTVICKTFGYANAGTVETGEHGIGSDPIVIGDVQCTGTETSLLHCTYRKQSTCTTNIAAVNCSPTVGTTGSIGEAAGIVAAIIICLVAIIGVIILLGACLWRNDYCVGARGAA